MFDQQKFDQINEKIKTLLLGYGVQVPSNRTSQELELELDFLRCCKKLKVKLHSPGAKALQKKHNFFL